MADSAASPAPANEDILAHKDPDLGAMRSSRPIPATAHQQAHDCVESRTISITKLPPLPDDSIDFSIASPTHTSVHKHCQSDDSALLDQNIKNHLRDIESSFMPDGSPDGQASFRGADDTYLFGGSPGRTGNPHRTPGFEEGGGSSAHDLSDAGAELVESNETFNETDDMSSPAAAAMARTQHRVESSGVRNVAVVLKDVFTESNGERIGVVGIDDNKATSFSTSSTHDETSDPNVTDSADGLPLATPLRRPDSFHNRQSSHHSSTSSLMARSDVSGTTDDTLEADFAIQSGGAMAANSQRRSQLSRLSSLGSVSSLRSSYSDALPNLNRTRSSTNATMAIDTALERLEEEEGPATPRALNHIMVAPSDTVIAKHIREIQVPETVAREYRAKHSSTRSPERRKAIGMSVSTRSSKNLTLKDTNDKIDKLSKENFDLKLKIHFLDQTLSLRSTEGMKEIIDQNVQLQMDLANSHKESQSLRRKVRDLERKLKVKDELVNKSPEGEGESSSDGEKAEMEEEIIYLRETVQRLESQSERLRSDNMTKEMEKRKLAEYIKTTNDMGPKDPSAVEEKDEMWKEVVEAETARREAADEEAEMLRGENRRLKHEMATRNQTNVRNVYNISKRNTTYSTRSEMGQSDVGHGETNGVESQATTVVSQLQQEKSDLRRENSELRRDLSAQTSMLTSRNKERERLQGEIEDLKIQSRRGGMDGTRSVAGDSILDRSVSRAHQRSSSRASGMTRITHASDPERDEVERKLNSLRDEIIEVKMLNQDLENALNSQIDTVETLETDLQRYKVEAEHVMGDMQQLQQERDELLQSLDEKDADIETLRAQAIDNIEALENELDQKDADFTTIQNELKSASESVVMLEDELTASRRKEESLTQQLEESEQEIEQLDQKVQDISALHDRLEVQLEGSQKEVAFLREEQESDKIKIGELEASLNAAQIQLEDMMGQAALERRQRDALDSEEKIQIQAAMDELNLQSSSSRDEIRKLRKKLDDKHNEAEVWRERLETFEANIREALGDINGTRSSILKDITKLQRDLEHTLSALDISRQDLGEKERTLRARDTLLESAGLETKKLSELLDKERQGRRADKASFESIQRSQQSLTRTLQQTDTRVFDLEQSRQGERRKYAALEQQLKDQLSERNSLLFSLWNKLATLCGRDFIQKHSLEGDKSPTSEVISRNLPGFSKNLSIALKTLETVISSCRSQIRDLERTFTKEFANVERALDLRTKRIDHLEKAMRQSENQTAGDVNNIRDKGHIIITEEGVTKLRNENKLLKAEVDILRSTSPIRDSVPTRGSSNRGRRESMMRHYSNSAVEGAQDKISLPSHVALDPTVTVPSAAIASSQVPNRAESLRTGSPVSSIRRGSLHHQHGNVASVAAGGHSRASSSTANAGFAMQPSEQRWVLRLKELERRLKAEREARLLDRSGARKRIEDFEAENDALRQRLEREIERRQSVESSRPADTEEEMLDRGLESLEAH